MRIRDLLDFLGSLNKLVNSAAADDDDMAAGVIDPCRAGIACLADESLWLHEVGLQHTYVILPSLRTSP